jgi:hypothetical protein
MLAPSITHAPRPIDHCLVVHLHSRCPAGHDKLPLVTRGMVVAASVTQCGKRLSQGRSFVLGVRVKEELQLEMALVGDTVLPKLGDCLGRHFELPRAILCISLCRLEGAVATTLSASEQRGKEAHSD